MTADPMRWFGDLDYPEPEPVRLDIAAIVARGTRLRRTRFFVRTAAFVLVLGVVPTTISMDQLESAGGGEHVALRQHRPRMGYAGTINGVNGLSAGSGGAFGPEHAGAPYYGQLMTFQARVQLSVRLPQAYGTLYSLAGDQAGPGAWFWGETSQIRLFHLSPDGHLKSWPVLPVTAGLRGGAAAGFAVTAAGIAWLGLNATLIRIDTRTGRVRSWQVPAPRLNSYQPAGQAQVPQIQALGVSPSGNRVALAMQFASSVPVLDVRTGRFHQVLLPARADQPQAIGFARDGTLGIGYQHTGPPHASGVLQLTRSGRRVISVVTESYGVTPYRSASLVVGTSQPDIVTGSGAVRPLYQPLKLIDLTGAPLSPARVPGNRLASVLAGKILVFPAGARSVAAARAGSSYYLLPAARCPAGLSLPPGPGRDQPRRPVRCRLELSLLATDKDGNVWAVPQSGQPTIDLLRLPALSR